MGMGLFLAGLSGGGNALADSAVANQKFSDEQSLLRERSNLEEEKAKRIAEFSNQLQNAPLNRAGTFVRQASQQQAISPVDQAPSSIGASQGGIGVTPGTSTSGTWGDINASSKALQPSRNAEQLEILKGELAAEKDPENIAALQREIARVSQTVPVSSEASQKSLNATPGAKQNKLSHQEIIQLAYQSALDAGDLQAATQLKSMIPDKTLTVAKDAAIVDAADPSKVIFANTSGTDKERMKIEADRRLQETKGRQNAILEAMKLDPLGINAPPGGYLKSLSGSSENQPSAQSNSSESTIAEKIQGKTGQEALDLLPTPIKSRVQAILDGRESFPSTARNNPRNAQLLDLAAQVDPSFDAINFNKRNQTALAFSKGKQSDAVRAANQTIAHMGSLYDAIDKLDNFSGMASPLNYIVNPTEKLFGDARQGIVQQDIQAVSSELRKVFAGAGGGNLTELKEWQDSLPLNASKTAQKAYLLNGLNLLHGAVDALQTQYENGMGKYAADKPLISKKSQQILNKIQGTSPLVPGSTETQPVVSSSKVVDYASLK